MPHLHPDHWVPSPRAPRHEPREAGRVEPPLWGLVGDTPLLPLAMDHRRPWGGAELWLKAEWLNPGGSVKDRPAREILREAVASGVLPGRRLLDASSGNTAIAYAMLGAAAGIGVTVCVPGNASLERKVLLRAYGAELIETDALEGSDGAILRARALAAERPDRFWYADQYNNAANPQAHEATTGPELWRQTAGRITHLVAGVGTGGTLMGAGRFLKKRRPDIQLVGVQPDSPFHGLEGLKHMETAIVPKIYDAARVDRTEHVATERAEEAVRWLVHERGLFVGWSTGAALAAAERVIEETSPAARRDLVIVVIAPDSGQRYLSERERLEGRER